MQPREVLMEIQNLNKFFYGKHRDKIVALNRVSFSVFRTETLGIVGESGSGKSTLARIIARIQESDSGRILFHTKDCTVLNKSELREYRRKVQMVFQQPFSAFSPRMSIEAFLCEGLINYGVMDRKRASQAVIRLLGKVGLEENCLGKLPHQLSGGQLQRVVIARAISVEPELIIYDEATSALDVSVQRQVLSLISELQWEMGLTSLFIGHDLSVVRLISDRILVMYHGKIVEIIESETLEEKAQHPYTRELLKATFSTKDTKENKRIRIYDEKEFRPSDTGCPYVNRCAYSLPLCREEEPLLEGDLHNKVACHRYGKDLPME